MLLQVLATTAWQHEEARWVVVTCGRPRWMAPYVANPIRHGRSSSGNPEKGEVAGPAC
jgi:hypothetical protein